MSDNQTPANDTKRRPVKGRGRRAPRVRQWLADIPEKDEREIFERIVHQAKNGDRECLRIIGKALFPTEPVESFPVKTSELKTATQVKAVYSRVISRYADGKLDATRFRNLCEGLARLMEAFHAAEMEEEIEHLQEVIAQGANPEPGKVISLAGAKEKKRVAVAGPKKESTVA
tara:strand:+ start:733 stop:1251 length:519 start_codon:yes stop_codon:yes gene_type:complete